jgi:hypothetical protein
LLSGFQENIKLFVSRKEQADKLCADESIKEKYDRWRYYYPKFDTTQIWVKVSSQELKTPLAMSSYPQLRAF